jgi:hypothetical protein
MLPLPGEVGNIPDLRCGVEQSGSSWGAKPEGRRVKTNPRDHDLVPLVHKSQRVFY